MRYLSEAQLEQYLKSGNQKEFEILYDRFADALYGILLRILRDEALAEDTLQEAFMKIWRNAQAYQPEKGTVFTWMLNIARNHAIDRLRSTQKVGGSQSQTSLDNVYMAATDDLDPGQTLERNELKAVVHKLPEPLRILIDLVYIQGFTQAEVADQLDIPLGTVKTRIRTALQLLRTALEVTKTNNPR